uniref:Putative secreted protein n=1 Tax=Anopheles darlingi TaxID=43151 RepID=A0A2M4DHW5_ANODA
MWQIGGWLLLLLGIATTGGHAVHTGVTSTSRVMAGDTRRRLLRHAHHCGSQAQAGFEPYPLLLNGYNNCF